MRRRTNTRGNSTASTVSMSDLYLYTIGKIAMQVSSSVSMSDRYLSSITKDVSRSVERGR